jgi:hypothetical protein
MLANAAVIGFGAAIVRTGIRPHRVAGRRSRWAG